MRSLERLASSVMIRSVTTGFCWTGGFALRWGGMFILVTSCALLGGALAGTLLVAAPEAPVDLPLPRWLYLRGGRLVHDGAPAPELEQAPDEALA